MFGLFFRPEFQGISPENMAKHMWLTLAKHFEILKFPWMYPYPISFHDLQLIVCMIWLWINTYRYHHGHIGGKGSWFFTPWGFGVAGNFNCGTSYWISRIFGDGKHSTHDFGDGLWFWVYHIIYIYMFSSSKKLELVDELIHWPLKTPGLVGIRDVF